MNYRFVYESPANFPSLVMESDGDFLTGLYFLDSKNERENQDEFIEKWIPIFDETKKWLDLYFEGINPDFTPKYKLIAKTDFQKEVLEIIKGIPYGKTITYGEIAKIITNRRGIKRMSYQAVGVATGSNKLCLIIPCHRVIGAKGNLVGYGGGIKNKIALLGLEGNDIGTFYVPSKGNKL